MSFLNIEVGSTDHLDPEVQAMCLAMYSRNFGPIADRIPSNAESTLDHKAKLGKYYVNWGHKSVGQLGVTTVWLEGVSQLAAKAIEYHKLFNGQESSTRYIDYSNQPMYSVNSEISEWQEKWRAYYIKLLPAVTAEIEKQFPIEEQINLVTDVKEHIVTVNEKTVFHYRYVNTNSVTDNVELLKKDTVNEVDTFTPYIEFDSLDAALSYITEVSVDKLRVTYNNTIKARAFDICRGFLPAGSTTNVGFMGTFDTLNDHFGEMLHHPCQEMRDIAVEVLVKMKEKYPFGTMDIDKLTEQYSYVDNSYFYPNAFWCRNSDTVIMINDDMVLETEEERVALDTFLKNRKKGQKANKAIDSKLNFIFRGHIDFGSYRDLHRHRNGEIDMMILTPTFDFHSFYLNNIPASELKEFIELKDSFIQWYNDSKIDKYELQYAIPMGFVLSVTYKCGLNQALYLLELRSGKTVHNSLRNLMHHWATNFTACSGIVPIVDYDEDNFTLKRGTQTIIEETVVIETDSAN